MRQTPKSFNNTFRERAIGFEDLLDSLQTKAYTPYNIIRLEEDDYVIEVACAGFAMGDIDVTLEADELVVIGTNCLKDSEVGQYAHQGISKKDIEHKFKIFKDVEVVYARLVNGILSIKLHKLVPEHEKPKKITIM